jgi:formamidopyrimidine-DNA glycosylase
VPELPEVETIARVLRQHLLGQRLDGARLAAISRHGKALLFNFSDAAPGRERLVARLGMTGTLRLNAPPDKHTQTVLQFERDTLVYSDIRKFGRLVWSAEPLHLGPDILAMPAEQLAAKLATRERAIKPLLLDQALASGLGNIYVDECLFAARTHPLTPASCVDAVALSNAVTRILEAAIAAGGSTISDFFDPLGRAGQYQLQHRVYGRSGEPCPNCGAPIVRLLVAQRGTHICPQCQPLPLHR